MSKKSKKKSEADKAEEEQKTLKQIIVEELKFIAGLAAFLFLFFNFVFGHYKIPSESMQPTLEVGDHLYVNKFAYGFSKHSLILNMHKLPFLKDGRVFARMPKRGDVVVFRNPNEGMVMIKRLVGLPGDLVETRNGRLYVNDELMDREKVDQFSYREHKGMRVNVSVYEEQLPDEKDSHLIFEQFDEAPQDFDTPRSLDNIGPIRVPEGKFFFMGDNRDNSEDSRAIVRSRPSGPGLVPFDHLIGRAEVMVFSFKKCKEEEGLHCPGSRWFKKL